MTLRDLRDGWSGPGSIAPDAMGIEAAEASAARFEATLDEAAELEATRDGGVLARWGGGARLQVVHDVDGAPVFAFAPGRDEWGLDDDVELEAWVARRRAHIRRRRGAP